jgi:hypothetical protein
LTTTRAPVRPSRVAEVRTGVRCTLPAIRVAADRTASAFTLTSSPSMREVKHDGREVAWRRYLPRWPRP